jgi:sulfite reductase (NADPH) flavoprotein alpha-component
MVSPTPTSPYDKNNPFTAKMVKRRRLCREGSLKDTQHFAIDLRGSGLTYTCGDSLGVFPENCSELVSALLERLGFTGEEPVLLPKADAPVSLREAFSRNLSLAGPTKKVLEAIRAKATESGELARLENLLDPAHAEELKEYLANREFLDLAEEFPSARFEAQE